MNRKLLAKTRTGIYIAAVAVCAAFLVAALGEWVLIPMFFE